MGSSAQIGAASDSVPVPALAGLLEDTFGTFLSQLLVEGTVEMRWLVTNVYFGRVGFLYMEYGPSSVGVHCALNARQRPVT